MKISCFSILYIFLINSTFLIAEEKKVTVNEIISSIDKNLYSKSQVYTSKMIVHGRRTSRTIAFKAWVVGTKKAFTKYISPPREAGTKMLKNDDILWRYSPQTDRTIQISGHMLRLSVMGSDMSYNDMMEEQPLMEMYLATMEKNEMINDRKHYVLFLEGKLQGLTYPKRRIWVDAEYMLPIKEELYAKSGKILKSISLDDIKKIQGRWFPTKFIFKDELKRNSKGTEWIIENIQFDVDIPETQFSKALLRK